MNIAIMKTRLEQTLAEQFERAAGALPGTRAVAAARQSAIGRFAALGLPHRRIEEWKYTDLRNALRDLPPPAVEEAGAIPPGELESALGPLAAVDGPRIVFVNGRHNAELSSLAGVTGVAVQSLAAKLEAGEADVGTIPDGDNAAVVALNAAYVTDGAVVRVADGAVVDKPLLLIFVRAGAQPRAVTTRNLVAVGRAARVTIVEAYVGLPGATIEGHTNTLTEIEAADGAEVDHIKCVADVGRATHLSNTRLRLGADTSLRGFQFTQGTPLARNQIEAVYGGPGGKLDLSGAFLVRGSEHIDTTLTVDHAVPHCESRELFKGVLDGNGRGIFQGKIIVRPDAQKTDGKQMAQALMLSPDAEFDSKPELEIYADDVVCGHGSTAAELDDDLLFYCQARGIPLAEARAMLTESFVGEAMDKVRDESVREALMTFARQWLATAHI
jgi:Fe-S cluster assembly protein SufD